MAAVERPRATAKDRALRLLSHRARSREELRRRLLRAGFEDAEIETALADLEAVGLVDDERFARDVVAHELSRRSGSRAVISSLRRRGLSADLAERALDEAGPLDEEERALEAARARLSRLGRVDDAVAYRRLLGYLQRRGYQGAAARDAARRAMEEAR